MSIMLSVTTFSPKSKILTKETDNSDMFETLQFMYRYLLMSNTFLPSFFYLLQQLMRERQQMASRPFASVAVTLDVGSTQVELLQGGIEVSLTFELGIHPNRF